MTDQRGSAGFGWLIAMIILVTLIHEWGGVAWIDFPFGRRVSNLIFNHASPSGPTIQDSFDAIIEDARSRYQDAPTDFLKGPVRLERRQHLCALGLQFAEGWAGRIRTIERSGEYAVVAIETAGDITFVNRRDRQPSPYQDNWTMIAPNSPLFRKLADFYNGEWVRFSGSLHSASDDCFEELSTTEEVGMTRPRFLFQFTDIKTN